MILSYFPFEDDNKNYFNLIYSYRLANKFTVERLFNRVIFDNSLGFCGNSL